MFPICASSRTTVLRVSVCSLARQAKLISVPCADCLRSGQSHQTPVASHEHGHGTDGGTYNSAPFEQRDRSKRESVEKNFPSPTTSNSCYELPAGDGGRSDGGPSTLFQSSTLSSSVKFPASASYSVYDDISGGADLLSRQQGVTDMATASIDIPATYQRQQLRMYCAPEFAVSSPDLEDFHIRRGKLSQPVSESPKVLLTRNRVLPTYFDRKQLICKQLQFPSTDVSTVAAAAEHENSPDFDGLLQNTLGSRMEPLSPQEMAEQLSMVCGTPKQSDTGLILQPQFTSENYRKQVITRRERRATELTTVSPDEPLSRQLTGVPTTPISSYRKSAPVPSNVYLPSTKRDCDNGAPIAYQKSIKEKGNYSNINNTRVGAKANNANGIVEPLVNVALDDEVFVDERSDKIAARAAQQTNGYKKVDSDQHLVKFDLGEDERSGIVNDDAENSRDKSCSVEQRNSSCSIQQNGTGQKLLHSQVSSGSIAELRGCQKSQSLLRGMMKKELMQNAQVCNTT